MSTTRMSFGAVLGSVQSAATTITSTLDAATGAVGMLTAFVSKASDEQRVRHIADKEDFVENLIIERAEMRSVAALKAEKFMGKSPEHQRHFKAAYESFEALLRTPEELEAKRAAVSPSNP
jgi:hypothetical protein